MKRMLLRSLMLLAVGFLSLPVVGQNYEAQWKEVERLQRDALPASVVRATDKIYAQAEREGDFPQMLKAWLTRVKARRAISPDSVYVDVARLNEWGEAEPDAVRRSLLRMVLGNAYVELGRRAPSVAGTSDGPLSDDLSEWTHADFQNAMRRAYAEALSDMPLLARTSVDDYALLIEKGAESALFGHDLLSLVVGEVADRCDDFAYMADVYARAVECYRALGKADAACLMQLARMRYLYERNSPEGNPLYRNRDAYVDSLRSLLSRHASMAPYVYQEWADTETADSVKYALCREALQKYPRYKFADFFRLQLDRLTSPQLSFSVDGTVLEDRPFELAVVHRSVPSVRVRVKEASTGRVLQTKDFKLATPVPYAMNVTTLSLSPLPRAGRYVVEMQAGGETRRLELNYSRLRPVIRRLPDGRWQVLTLDNLSGHPVEGVEVEWMKQDYSHRKPIYHSLGKARSGSDGAAYFTGDDFGYWLCASKAGYGRTDTLRCTAYGYSVADTMASEYTYIYTDRAVYRPGQTIQVSGLVFSGSKDEFAVCAGREVKLTVTDANGNTLAEQTVKTNDMGSFSTQVALPETCMPGVVRIEGNDGSVACRVEEYKRPVFEVELKPLRVAYALGDSVTMEGTALNYTGTPVAGGEVQYTVTRSVRWSVRGQQPELTVAAGTTTVDADGRFQIPFRLVSSASKDDRYAWDNFVVSVSVTSSAGETQEATHALSAGNKSLDLGNTSGSLYIKERLDSIMLTAYNSERRMVGVEVEYAVCPLSYDEKRNIQVGEPLCTGRSLAGQMFFPAMLKGLPSGWYRMCLTATDGQGRKAEGQSDFALFSLDDKRIPVEKALWTYQDSYRFEEGKPVTLKIGTAELDVCLFYDVFAAGKLLESKRFLLSDSLLTLRLENRPEYADGVLVQCLVLKDGVVHMQDLTISPAERKRDLQLRWETFRDRLRPGDTEEWRLRVTLPDGTPANAELLATMYDKSLDRYQRLHWPIGVPRFSRLPYVAQCYPQTYLPTRYFSLATDRKYGDLYWNFDEWIDLMHFYGMMSRGLVFNGVMAKAALTGSVAVADMKSTVQENSLTEAVVVTELAEPAVRSTTDAKGTEQGTQTTLRTDFSETAFFYPHIRTDSAGIATIAFTLPESLTTWRFMGLAHTRNMYHGLLEDEVVASKEFMLQPQLPRFVRVGDEATLSATIENRSAGPVKGTVRMELFDPQTGKTYASQKQPFEVAAGESTVASFRIELEETALLACRMVADGDAFSDGEQRYLPVLSNKEWITESRTVSVNGAGHHEVDLHDLFNHNSRTATNRRLTVEYTNNPAWLAVMALPSLGQPDNDDAISLSSAYYALSLGGWVAKAYPRIREVCKAWQAQGGDGETLWSQLQKNRELKNILLEETPWLADADNEAEQRRLLSTLFDLNTLGARTATYLQKLTALQRADGAWSWYPGMGGNRYVTTSVVETLLRLNHLTDGAFNGETGQSISRAMNYLAEDAMEEYKRMKEAEAKGAHDLYPSELTLHYLYLQTLYGKKLSADRQTAFDYFLDKLARSTSRLSIFGKAASAYILCQAGREEAGRTFLQSCLEYSVQTPELGRYYDTDIAQYAWADYRIPTQTMVIDVCRSLGVADSTVNEFQQWLLKQKQVQAWDTPLNSVNAVYALLAGRGEWLDASEPAMLKLDRETLDFDSPASALGYVKQTIALEGKSKAPKTLTVEQKADHLSWGAVYAQYLEELDKVGSHAAGLSVERRLLVRRLVDGKEEWQEVQPGEALAVGDRVLSRLIVRADRDMDFVQIEDKQAACMEPGVVLSGYRWTDGVGCYRVVKDASVRYFADRFRKGVHMFDMECTLTAPGTYRLGIATIQSAYAPELNAHSDSAVLTVE